ncbi:MAG TPA: hypothetical protein VNF47_15785 [Streptosporangiaceae bacterium]|nr:hypothetical protein [Streptosporangiaceae bacterium]
MGEESRAGAKSESRFQFWKDMPGWVQAIVAILGVLGLGGVAGGVAHSVASPHHSSLDTTSSSPSSIRWQGAVAINSNGLELDDLPPTTGGSTYTVTNSGGSLLSGNGSFATWQGTSTPSYGQCHTFVLTHGSTSALQLTSGMALCVRTGSGRTAYVKITSMSSDGSTAQAQVTVWSQ